MNHFEHLRHKEGSALSRPRELIVACAPMRSNVNISSVARTASACAVERLVLTGNARSDGYRLVGLEQTTNSTSMHSYNFSRRTVLVVGNERTGLTPEILELLDDVVEIPVYGLPHSFNAATAASMALYEYCRQYPSG
jgi:tRNA G18 (ribose-2'-O)-methylase SpoU